jgi:hypothetical protein
MITPFPTNKYCTRMHHLQLNSERDRKKMYNINSALCSEKKPQKEIHKTFIQLKNINPPKRQLKTRKLKLKSKVSLKK